MDSRLFMEIGFVNASFQAVDKSPYERWINDGDFDESQSHLVVHRLLNVVDGEDPTVIGLTFSEANDVEEIRDAYEIDDITNGLYYYQKLIIPFGTHSSGANEHLYYNTEDGKVHYDDEDSGTSVIYSLNNIDDFDAVYEIIRKVYPDNCFYFDDYAFTIYDLVECYVLTERERINNYLKNNCKSGCKGADLDLTDKADILLAAIMVLKDLIEKGDYFEAQRILNGLNTCGNLCKKYTKNLKGCGCGRS